MKLSGHGSALRALFPAATALALACAVWGCAAPRPDTRPLRELSQEELDAFLERGVDSRSRGITIHGGAAGPEFASGNQPWPGKLAGRPLKKVGAFHAPVIKAKTPDKMQFAALVDTSARQSWLLYDAAPAMGFRPFREGAARDPLGEYPDHVRASIPGYAGCIHNLILDRLYVSNPVFYVPPGHGPLAAWTRADVPGASWALLRGEIRAVFGNALLKEFVAVQLNFPAGSTIWTTISEFKGPKGALWAKMGDWRGRPTVRIRLGGRDFDAVVDTAGDFEVSVPAELLSGPLPEEGAEMTLEWGGALLDGDVRVTTHERENLPADWPPRLGWRFWRRGILTLDYARRRVYFESPDIRAPETGDEDSPEKPSVPAGGSPHYRGVRP